jgi:hypothetical protein
LQISDWGGSSDPVNAKLLLVGFENVQQIDRIIDMLFANKMISESTNSIVYYF